MKRIFLIFVLGCLILQASAQRDFNDSISQSRNRITRDAMIVLGSWAVANIASGFIVSNSLNGEAKYIWRMNAYWNFINLGLAGLGYAGVRMVMSRKFSFSENYVAQHAIEKLYVFNAGLDLVYITGGLYLRERGKNESPGESHDMFKGYGTSLIFQGSFLLVMDAVVYVLHHKNTLKMDRRLKHWELNASPGSIGLQYKF